MVRSGGDHVTKAVSKFRVWTNRNAGAGCICFRSVCDERTKGIEIRLLKTSTENHIAIWDLAGQDEYHALHDSHYMFPDINQACMFLFLFRPFNDEDKLCLGKEARTRFKEQLRYWLSFINSNARKTGWVLPKVSVVLTHLDKLSERFGQDMKRRADNYVRWADPIVSQLREDFKSRVEIHDRIHAVNAFADQDASVVVDHILETFNSLFTTLPKVPAACEEMNVVLAKWTEVHPNEPIITSDKFFDLCKSEVSELNSLFASVPDDLPEEAAAAQKSNLQKTQLAVISYLHDVGCIIHFQESDFVVVDPNWLGQVFLGDMFKPGDAHYDPKLDPTDDGIVTEEELKSFLDDFIITKKYVGFGTNDLIKLMKELELCYEGMPGTTKDPHYFIPSTLKDPGDLARHGRRKLSWSVRQPRSSPVYTGIRLQSTDQSRTFLSPGVFQRFQVHLLKLLRGPSDQHESRSYKIMRNLIIVKHDGVEMMVESSGETGHYVDILMQSYGAALDVTLRLYKYVVDELRAFCASRKGCPGVALQEAILRPACVEHLTLCVYRKNQVVVKEDLKMRVVKRLAESEDLEIWVEGAYGRTLTEETWRRKMYKHRFEAVKEAKLDEEWVDATDMLNLMDIKDAFFKYRVVASQQAYAIYKAVDELNRIAPTGVTNPTPSHAAEITARVPVDPCDIQPEQPPTDNRSKEIWQMYLEEMERRMRDDTAQQFRELQEQMNRIGTTILEKLDEQRLLLLHLQKSLDDLQMVQRNLHITLSEKIDQVLNIKGLQEISHGGLQEMPRIPYFTDEGVELSQRIIAFIRIGTPLKLHFMCEEPSKVHFVKNQKGRPIVNHIDGKVYEKLRPLILGSIKLLYILVKAGLHVAAGIGNVVPDYAGAVELTAGSLTGEVLLGDINTMCTDEITGRDSLAAAWACIQEIMSPLMSRGEIPSVFKLYQVKYKSNYLTAHLFNRQFYWICNDCRQKANNAGQLEDFNAINMTKMTSHGI